jgi:hypothetical protein
MLLLAVVFLLGVAVIGFWFLSNSERRPVGAVGWFWFFSNSKRNPVEEQHETGSPDTLFLSDSTKAVLSRLDSPLEIRFYAILDSATVSEALTAFASRVGQLLSAYQQEAGGKIKLIRFDAQANLDPSAAAADGIQAFNSSLKQSRLSQSQSAAVADGIQAFNLDKGEACYLGLTLAYKGRKESLVRLAPEWAQALEPDVTRAIARLLEAPQPYTVKGAVSQVNTAAVQEVKALIPDLATVSVEAGKQILQDAALKDFSAAVKEMETQLKEAEKGVTQAQNGGSEADQQTARKHLQQVQAEQTEKLKQIAARSKAQIDAFQQIKAAAR